MVRKKLHLEEAQDKALKRRARELGISEAEVVRQALDEAFSSRLDAKVIRGQREILNAIFHDADEFANTQESSQPYKFDRQALYEEDQRYARRRDGE
ncbi:MAG: ribbon-helix-helix protein, CopG family [Trueperaceae bacterium]